MITISLCMIVKNEEGRLNRCLDSVKDIVDEIIIVDTGSTDSTKEIAKSYTSRVYDFKWVDNFSVARNYSYSKATMDYILWLDADDVILEPDRIKFMRLKEEIPQNTDIVMMLYNANTDLEGNVILSYYRERLSKRSNRYRWHEPVHEYMEIWGNVINTDICITHCKEDKGSQARNISIYEKNIAMGNKLSTRGLYYYGRELFHSDRFSEAISYFTKFLEAQDGWVEDKIAASFNLALCHISMQESKKAFEILIDSFKFDTPRAEICCLLGDHYFELEDYRRAITWYGVAANLEKPQDSWGFILHDYWSYIPIIQLCVCYDRLGDFSTANHYNEIAGGLKPSSPVVEKNREYFREMGIS